MDAIYALLDLELCLVLSNEVIRAEGIRCEVSDVPLQRVSSFGGIYALAVDVIGINSDEKDGRLPEKLSEIGFDFHRVCFRSW